MIPIAILLAIALAAGFCSWMEYRYMTRVDSNKPRSGNRRPGIVIEISSRRAIEKNTRGIHLVTQNQLCKDLQG